MPSWKLTGALFFQLPTHGDCQLSYLSLYVNLGCFLSMCTLPWFKSSLSDCRVLSFLLTLKLSIFTLIFTLIVFNQSSGADPGFSEGGGGGLGFGQTSAYIVYLLLLFNKSFLTRKSVVKIFAFVSL